MKNEKALTPNELVTMLVKSPHGKLSEYVAVSERAMREDPFLFHHLIAWNEIKGQIRDSRVALPVLGFKTQDAELRDNSLAHLAKLDPRNLMRAVRFAKEYKTGGFRSIVRVVQQYLEARERNPKWMERTILQHRSSVAGLYGILHLKTPLHVKQMLSWKAGDLKLRPVAGSALDAVRRMKTMDPVSAAGQVFLHKIPYLTARVALPKIKGNTEALVALVKSMSPSELVNNTGMLNKMGMDKDEAVQAAYRHAVKAMEKNPNKAKNLFKAGSVKVADEETQKTLAAVQEKQFANKGINGNWLILADRSGSMQQGIAVGTMVAGALAKLVRGEVRLVFFNHTPVNYVVQGKTLEEIQKMTRGIMASGGTSIGCGLEANRDFEMDGIAIISDGGETAEPVFSRVYNAVLKDSQVPVYFYKLRGDLDILTNNCKVLDVPLETFDLRNETVDYYSLANLVQTMRANRYSLYQEIMDTPLLTLAKVFNLKEEVEYV